MADEKHAELAKKLCDALKAFGTDDPHGASFVAALDDIDSADDWKAVRARLAAYPVDGGGETDMIAALQKECAGDAEALARVEAALKEAFGSNLAGEDVMADGGDDDAVAGDEPSEKHKELAKKLCDAIQAFETDDPHGMSFIAALDDIDSVGDWKAVRAVLAKYPQDGDGETDMIAALQAKLADDAEALARVEAALKEGFGSNLAGEDVMLDGGDDEFADEGDAPAPEGPEPTADDAAGGAAADADAENTAAADSGDADDADETCDACGNKVSQPFCGQTGKPHRPKAKAAKKEGGGKGRPAFDPSQFSSDRACTACGDGGIEGEEPRQAVFVCRDCDGKFCETCWDYEHTNQKRVHHEKLVLFYDCDICTGDDADARVDPMNPGPHPAVWYCEECALMLCKQHFFDEHKNPDRKAHMRPQFLYPGGEDGPFRDAHQNQRVACGSTRFDPSEFGRFIDTPDDLVCTVCFSKDDTPAVYHCAECDPASPERLCERCWLIEHRVPARRSHPRRLLLIPCDVCHTHERRPARNYCQNCKLNVCDVCDRNEHRHPARKNHLANPLYTGLTNPEARDVLAAAFRAADGLPSDLHDDIPAPLDGGSAVYLPSPRRGSASHRPPPSAFDAATPPGGDGGSPSHYRAASTSPDFDAYGTPLRPGARGASQDPGSEVSPFHHYRHRLVRFYNKYNPSKLPGVVSQLEMYKGKEESFLQALAMKYGPEPQEAYAPLPTGWRLVESSKGDLFYIHIDGRKQWARPTVE